MRLCIQQAVAVDGVDPDLMTAEVDVGFDRLCHLVLALVVAEGVSCTSMVNGPPLQMRRMSNLVNDWMADRGPLSLTFGEGEKLEA